MKKLLTVILLCVLIGQIIYVFNGIFQNPFPTGDAYGIWFLKAKVLSTNNPLNGYLEFINNPDYSFSHPEYPVLWPIILSGFYRMGINLMLVYPVIYIMLLWGCYVIVAKKTSRFVGLVAAFLTSTIVTIERFGGVGEVGFADLPLALFLIAVVAEYYKDKPRWWLMGLIAGLMANIKFEGLLAGILMGIVIRPVLSFWMFFLPLSASWVIFSRLIGLKSIYEVIGDDLTEKLSRIPLIVGLLFKEMVNFGRYGIWPVIFLVSLGVKTDRKIMRINYFILLYILCLAGSYIFSPLNLISHWDTSYYRLVSVMIPLIICNSSIMMVWNSEKKS